MMTREAFMAQLAGGGATQEWLDAHGFEVNPCDCGVDYCEGWKLEFTKLRDEIERARAARGVTKQPCPRCGRHLDSASADDDSVPEPGDISVCAYCSSVLEFTAEGPMRIIPQEEIDTFPKELQRSLAEILIKVEVVRALKGQPRLGQE